MKIMQMVTIYLHPKCENCIANRFFKNKQDLFCVKSKKLNCAKIYDVAHIFLIFVR